MRRTLRSASAALALFVWVAAAEPMFGCTSMTDACPDGMEDCGDFCSNTKIDDANCGDCGNACGKGEVCGNGFCGEECDVTNPDRCATGCVDFSDDPSNCGECGNECPAGRECTLGECDCPTFTELCGTECCDSSGCCNGICCPEGSTCDGTTCI